MHILMQRYTTVPKSQVTERVNRGAPAASEQLLQADTGPDSF